MRTEEIGGHSPYKAMWWKVDLSGVYNIYSINILFKNYDGFGKLFYLVIFEELKLRSQEIIKVKTNHRVVMKQITTMSFS